MATTPLGGSLLEMTGESPAQSAADHSLRRAIWAQLYFFVTHSVVTLSCPKQSAFLLSTAGTPSLHSSSRGPTVTSRSAPTSSPRSAVLASR